MPRVHIKPKTDAPRDTGRGALDLVDQSSPPHTEPTTATTATTAISEATADLVGQRRKNEIAAEELFAKLAADGVLSGDERNFVRQVAPRRVISTPQFESWLRKQAVRVATVKKQQATCGTPTERQEAQDRLTEAKKTLDKKGPEILRQIQELQAELAAYQEAVKAAEFNVQRRQEALKFLRREDKLPSYVQEALRVLRLSISEDRAEVGRLSSIVKTYHALTTWDGTKAEDRDKIFHHAVSREWLGGRLLDLVMPLRDPDHVSSRVGESPRRFCRSGWQAYLDSLRPERDAAVDRLALLGDVDAKIAKEAEILRSHLVPK